MNHASQVMRQVLQIEPPLTLTELRTRLPLTDGQIWQNYSVALRLAGLPE